MDHDRICYGLFLADATPTPTPLPPTPTVEGASVGIDNTRTSPSPAQLGDEVTFRIDVTLAAVPGANEAEVLVAFDSSYLSYGSASWEGLTLSQCQLIGAGIACDFGQVSADFSFDLHFAALAVTDSTATDATLGADFDGPGAGVATVAGPASASVAIVDVAGVQLPPLGDGSSALSAAGSDSLPLIALIVLLGATLGLSLGTLRRSILGR